MLPVRPICEGKNMRKDGTSLVFIQYCYSSENRTTVSTEIAIPPAYWNKKRLCISDNLPSGFGNADQLNNEVKRMIRLVEDIVEISSKKGMVDRGVFLKTVFKPDLDVTTLMEEIAKVEIQVNAAICKTNLDVFFQLDDYIRSKSKKVSKGTLGVYNQMKEHLSAFQQFSKQPITFESFDYNFYDAFVEFLTYEFIQKRRKQVIKGLRINTIGKSIKHFRGFIKDRVKRKIIPSIDLSDFKGMEEEADAIYLTEQEIEAIRRLDLTNYSHLEKYRDLLVLGCLTGLRFSDFTQIRPEDVRGRKLYKKQEKSEHWVVIPLKEAAFNILMSKFQAKVPKVTNPDFNYYIKEVGKLAGICEQITFSHKRGNKDYIETKPKYQWITSHTCRRSFCTNEFLAETPVLLIMKISGHKKEKDFYKYIRITPEQAAFQIESLWAEREKVASVEKKHPNGLLMPTGIQLL